MPSGRPPAKVDPLHQWPRLSSGETRQLGGKLDIAREQYADRKRLAQRRELRPRLAPRRRDCMLPVLAAVHSRRPGRHGGHN